MGQLDMFSLQDRVALIPGGGGGIGAPMAEAIAAAGAKVAVAGRTRRRPRGRGRSRRGRRLGGPRDRRATRPTRPTPSGWSRETVDRFGRIDIVVNAVGGGAGKVLHPAEDYPRDAWDWIMELNVRSTLVPTQAAARAMIERGDGGADPQHHLGPRGPRHQRRLFGLRRREGRDRLADPPVGDRMGEARHPGQRDHADVRRHAPGRDAARRPGVQGRDRHAHPARARRRDARHRRARRSSSSPMPRRS